MAMKKQDRQVSRTPAALERKYKFGKNFKDVKKSASDSQKAADVAQKSAEEASNATKSKVDKNDNAQVVKMINEAVDVLKLKANRLEVESDHFKLSADGSVEATNVKISSATTDSAVDIGNGKISFISPATNNVNYDDTTSKTLLMTFRVYNLGSTTEYKEYGIYAYGEWYPKDDGTGFYWHASGTLAVEEIPISV